MRVLKKKPDQDQGQKRRTGVSDPHEPISPVVISLLFLCQRANAFEIIRVLGGGEVKNVLSAQAKERAGLRPADSRGRLSPPKPIVPT